jgi:hypothetical protein
MAARRPYLSLTRAETAVSRSIDTAPSTPTARISSRGCFNCVLAYPMKYVPAMKLKVKMPVIAPAPSRV